MTDALRSSLQAFLNALERDEARLLAWGVVDGAFTEDEVLDIADDVIRAVSPGAMRPEDLRDHALSYRLLFEFPPETTAAFGAHGRVYRTRMAETVRLLARLRQLGSGRPWRAAPSLVADYRFTVRPRAYPERHLPPDRVRDALNASARLSDLQTAALEALLPPSLADFQVDAAANILRDLDPRSTNSRGTIVGAGTGSGKTLAFYLPAFLHIARRIQETRGEPWAKAIAVYPRNELLKDQLSGAVADARALDGVLAAHRPISIGAYYGDTPYQATRRSLTWKWARAEAGDGFVCPYIRGPDGEPLTWLDTDLDAGTERLVGATRTGEPIVYGRDHVRLTRNACVADPPDIVFTTTEMMNRLLVNDADRCVLGLGPRVTRPPDLLLLDEAHTYNGLTGAHTAYLLRRWRKAVRGRPQFVGLSATLVGAQDFFARLVGINPASVVEITPRPDRLVQEGAEYLIALRGDPGTGTSLLSTSIQAAMLLGRALDPAHMDPSGGLYGRRTFAFTDNLDVTNRFFHSLLDAEGRSSSGQPVRPPMAATRSDLEDESVARLRAGQNWRMAEQIGHQIGLRVPLEIDRTSSQDAGVDARADVVVATASLEVGFDDPFVGAVLQHKAPLDNASFLQRKGRAGRKREMRPWTAVVLSDYGRDRAAYQAYDTLFDPALQEQNLPTANRYVLRIQAGFAFMDWLTEQLSQAGVGDFPDNVWKDLAYPPRRETNASRRTRRRARQDWVKARVRSLLDHGTGLSNLSAYLAGALRIDDDEVTALLWEPPRALMTALLPTLLRRLDNDWREWRPDGSTPDEPFSGNPLPDFLPPNFFTDLNLPEVAVLVPAHHGRDAEEHAMSIRQALSEFAPGRVSRRFGIQHANDAFWVPVDLDGPDHQSLDVHSVVPATDSIGIVHVREGAAVTPLRSLRPRQIRTELAPGQIRSSSNAFLTWASVLRPHPDASWETVSDRTGWASLVPRIAVHLHRDDAPADVARVATGARAEIGFINPHLDDRTLHVQFVEGAQPVGLGFQHTFDAVTFALTLPYGLGHTPPDPRTPLGRALRVAYVHHRVATSPHLDGVANRFAREWLAEALVSSLVSVAANDDPGPDALQRAAEAIWDDADGPSPFAVALEQVMAAAILDDDDDAERRGHDRVATLLQDPDVRPALDEAAGHLWAATLGPDYRDWLRRRYRATLGGALLQAVYALCPEIGGADLLLDLDGGPRAPDDPVRDEVWISESAVGGTGLLETFARRYADDPRRFFRLADAALSASDAEQVDVELSRTLALAHSVPAVTGAIAAVRAADGLHDLRNQTARLRTCLGDRGVLCSHAFFAALQARVLRPGASPASDDLLRRLIEAWRRIETDLGIEVDARAFALWAARRPEFEADIDALVGGVADVSQRFGVLYGLLWPRGRGVRARALGAYNPFAPLPDPDRLLVIGSLDPVPSVALDDPQWRTRLRDALRDRGSARLAAPLGRDADLAGAALALVQEPLDVGFLLLYPVVDGFERDADHVTAHLSLPESIQ